MMGQVTSEVRKAVTLPSTSWLVLAMVVGGAGLCAMLSSAAVGSDSPIDTTNATGVAGLYTLPVSMGSVLPLSLGVILVTAEIQHRTMTITRLAEPQTWRVYVGKLLVSGLGGGVMAVLTMASAVAVVGLILNQGVGTAFLGTARVQLAVVGSIVAFVLWAIIGAGLGAAIGNQTLAIAGVLLFTVFLEPFLRIVAGPKFMFLTQFLPGGASDALAGGSLLNVAIGTQGAAQWQGGVTLAVYALLIAGMGFIRLRVLDS